MALPYRHNNKWNISEIISLQREYQLLEMTIQEIANKHNRTIEAFLYKLQDEGFIRSWIDATGYQEYSKTKPYLHKLDNDLNYYLVNDNDYKEENNDDYKEENNDDYKEENNINKTFLFNHLTSITSSINDIKTMIDNLIVKTNISSCNEISSFE